MIHLPFTDRAEAGFLLAQEILRQDPPANAIVLALPRGGVPVGAEVAKAIGAPLDVVIIRKLGVPSEPELAMGAIASGAFRILDEDLISKLRISPREVDRVVAEETAELARREKLYRGDRPKLDLRGRTAVLVDDGLATGSTMLVAARYVRGLGPAKMVIAVPVGSLSACRRLRKVADSCVCLATPERFHAVGEWYLDFEQVTDEEVQLLLEQNSGLSKANPKPSPGR